MILTRSQINQKYGFKYTNMRKKLLLIICLVINITNSIAQYKTDIVLTDLDNGVLTSSVENTLSNLVTEINTAFSENRTPRLSGMKIDERAQTSILGLWENAKFRCDETEIVESVNHYGNEYEVRNIPFVFPDLEKNERFHEIAVTFNSNGIITSFHMSISQNLYRQVFTAGEQVKEFRRKQMILDYVEQFRTSYNTKDLVFLNQVFSDDALIITGRVVKPAPRPKDLGMSIKIGTKVEYTKQSKQEYLKKLSRVFKNNRRINVEFDEIEVFLHPTKDDWYGVRLHQGYTSDSYHDEGWLFLVWDFTDEDSPTIHVRTWQPDKDPTTKKDLPLEDRFGFDDVKFE